RHRPPARAGKRRKMTMNLQTIDTLGLGSVSGADTPRTLARVNGSDFVQAVVSAGVARNAAEFDTAARPAPPAHRLTHAAVNSDAAQLVPGPAATLVEILAAVASSMAAGARRLHDAWRLRARAHATYRALRSLDTRTLNDLGLERGLLASVAAELASEADRS